MRILYNLDELSNITTHLMAVCADPSRELEDLVMDHIFAAASMPFQDRCLHEKMQSLWNWVLTHRHDWISIETGRVRPSKDKLDYPPDEYGAIACLTPGREQSSSMFSTTALIIATAHYRDNTDHHFAMLWHPRNSSNFEKLAVLIPDRDKDDTLVLRGTTGISEARLVWTF